MSMLPPVLRLDGASTSLVFDLRRGFAELPYLGPALHRSDDAEALCDALRRGPRQCAPNEIIPPSILPQSGQGYLGTPACAFVRDGRILPTSFILYSVDADASQLGFVFRDAGTRATIETTWRMSSAGVVIVRTKVNNAGSETLTVSTLASLALPLPQWTTHVTRYSGRWAAEMRGERAPLSRSALGGASRGGRPGFGGANWVIFEGEAVSETTGSVLGAHLAWSGDHWQQIEHDDDGRGILLMGARLEEGEIVLAPGATWQVPDAVLAVGADGRASVRDKLHQFLLSEIVPPQAANTPRKVHINSWEALGFEMDQARIVQLADRASKLGVERFVLDDGWFSGRRDDAAGLGDWTPDPVRFPQGLSPVIEHVHALGMDFGLWVEPEMISPDSDLYRSHPDWCLHHPGAPRPTQRNQLVLDLGREDVSDHLFGVLDRLLADHAIAYLKWDHNRDLFPLASGGHGQALALYALLDRLREAHPEVEIETCASGGGRVDFEILRRCTRVWASDNNDAIERLRINAGWFDWLPLAIVGNHVGPSPNPITGRQLSMDFRAKVAMFGHMGIEADPSAMSEADRKNLAEHVALYKTWREILHLGRLTAVGCADENVFGWFTSTGGKGLALVAQTRFADDFSVPPMRLHGLEPDRRYLVKLLDPWPERAARHLSDPCKWREGLSLSGMMLAQAGLALPLAHPETAWLIAVERQP